MLDGGVCDSIPVCRAREDGFLNNVVILTKPKEYRVTRTTTNYHLLKELYDECRMEGEKLIRDMELISQISFAAIFRYLQEFS